MMTDIECLLASDLRNPKNRAVLADALYDAGREGEQALCLDFGKPVRCSTEKKLVPVTTRIVWYGTNQFFVMGEWEMPLFNNQRFYGEAFVVSRSNDRSTQLRPRAFARFLEPGMRVASEGRHWSEEKESMLFDAIVSHAMLVVQWLPEHVDAGGIVRCYLDLDGREVEIPHS